MVFHTMTSLYLKYILETTLCPYTSVFHNHATLKSVFIDCTVPPTTIPPNILRANYLEVTYLKCMILSHGIATSHLMITQTLSKPYCAA